MSAAGGASGRGAPAGGGEGHLVLVADVHLGPEDPDLDDFCAFLAERESDTSVLVLLGDIFALWLGRPKFTEAHHRRVLESCRALRAAGVRVVFIEGNREFGVEGWAGDAFDVVSDRMAAEPWAGRRWYLAHGDLLNREDYRQAIFRAIVRSPFVLGTFGLLPRRLGLSLSARIERALRHRNLRHKTSLPRSRLDDYATWLERRGFDGGVIGHIHVEHRLELEGAAGERRELFVLPDWRSSRRALFLPREGPARFVTHGGAPPAAPAVVHVVERGEIIEIETDRAPGLEPGQPVAISSGHGPEVRPGRVLEGSSEGSCRARLQLEPGPPVQVGDRVLGGAADRRST